MTSSRCAPFLPQDQYDHIDKHTQSGLDLLDRYIKFVKERTEVEQSYAKQLRCVRPPRPHVSRPLSVLLPLKWGEMRLLVSTHRSITKKYAKRGSKEELECK